MEIKLRTAGSAGTTGALRFATREGEITVEADITVLALGGASWPHLGSDGALGRMLRRGRQRSRRSRRPTRFSRAVVGYFQRQFPGQPLKRIALSFGLTAARGEAIITETGIEGGAFYALSTPLREAIAETGEAVVRIDLRPDMPHVAL